MTTVPAQIQESNRRILALIADDLAKVDQTIMEQLHSDVPLISQVSNYIILAGGKRIRPALLLLMCGALNFQRPIKYKMAAIIEFIHTATLLHDDVVDASTLRRGRATANQLFGNPASVLVGDFLYSRAFQMMVQCESMRIMQILAEATNVIAEGEVMQLMNVQNSSLPEEGYLKVIRSKTAKLFEASAQIAAVLAESTPEIEQACASYGRYLGTAFQVRDDALDYEGQAAAMGKNLGDDLREGKVTLPIIIALQRASQSDQALLRHAIENPHSSDFDQQMKQVQRIIQETQALVSTQTHAEQEAQAAQQAISLLPNSVFKTALLELAQQSVHRQQ